MLRAAVQHLPAYKAGNSLFRPPAAGVHPDHLTVIQKQFIQLGAESPLSPDEYIALLVRGREITLQFLHRGEGICCQVFVDQLFGRILQRLDQNEQAESESRSICLARLL